MLSVSNVVLVVFVQEWSKFENVIKFSFDLGVQHSATSKRNSSSLPVIKCLYCQCSSADLLKHFEEVKNHGFAKICPVCVKGYTNANSFRVHFDVYHKQLQKHKCQVCGKANQSKSHLVRHMKRHSEQTYFTCPICYEGFKHKSNLKEHIRRCTEKMKQQQ